ncbi:hypothetical protein C0992_009755, partial [Termitomyces sp. T32_za158]
MQSPITSGSFRENASNFVKSDNPAIDGHEDLLTQHPILRRSLPITEWEPNCEITKTIQNEVNDLEERVKITGDEINAASQRAYERTEKIGLVMDAIR